MLDLPVLVCKTSRGEVAAMRDICPHRGMPLSFGRIKDDCVECAYHGWRFDGKGRCSTIPALVEGSPIKPDKIGITTYSCRERDGYIWVFIPDPQQPLQPIPEVPPLPLPSSPYRMIQVSTLLDCAIDDGIVGLMDPAHGPYVHQSPFWRTQASMHEKAKTFEPIPYGFRMISHPPSKNSRPYKVLKWFYGGDLTTTVDFVLPNQRYEFIQCGSAWVSIRVLMTPLSEHQTRMDFSAAWNCFRWMPFGKSVFKAFAKNFLDQDRVAMNRQSVGLKYKPSFHLVGDADLQTRWYHKLKESYISSVQTGQPLDHPLKGRVTLHWKS